MEMRLRSTVDQMVRIDALELEIDFTEGEEIHTEISAKFTHGGIRGRALRGRLRRLRHVGGPRGVPAHAGDAVLLSFRWSGPASIR